MFSCAGTEETVHQFDAKRCSLCLRILATVSKCHPFCCQLCLQQQTLLAKSSRQIVDFQLWLAQLHSRGQHVVDGSLQQLASVQYPGTNCLLLWRR